MDKTRHIAWLENDLRTGAAIYLRPEGLGKTFLAHLLENYYDIAARDKFDENFRGNWIRSHKTRMASSYCVLSLDFSQVSAKEGRIEPGFLSALMDGITRFSNAYPKLAFPKDKQELELYSDHAQLLAAFCVYFYGKARNVETIYLIIDGYDQFALSILSDGENDLRSTATELHESEWFIKSFYACIKRFYGGIPGRPIAKVLITGVSAIALDSITSGFNIATDISENPRCAAMAGLTHDELSEIIDDTVDFSRLGRVSKASLMEEMERQFGGHSFSPGSGEPLFITCMCLYFLKSVIQDSKLPFEPSAGFVSGNLTKLDGVMKLADPSLRDYLKRIILGEPVISARRARLDLHLSDRLDLSMSVSLLKHLGYLSFPSKARNTLMPEYMCPNEACRRLFTRYLEDRQEFSDHAST